MTETEKTGSRRDAAGAVGAVFRAALYVYIVLEVLAVYINTADATIDIKRFQTAWAGLLIGGGWLLASKLFRIPWRSPGAIGVLCAGLVGLYGLATLFSPFFWLSLDETGIFISHAALFVVASQVFRRTTQVRRLLVVICAAVGASVVYAFMQFAGLDLVQWDDTASELYKGLPSTYGNPNFAAHMLILAMLMALALAALGQPMFLLVFAAFAIHFAATEQRGGIVALVAAAGLVGLGWVVGKVIRRPRPAALWTMAVGGALAVVGVVFLLVYLQQRTGSVLPLDPSLLIRYQSYASAARMLLEQPFLGHGPGVYALVNPQYWTTFESEWFASQLSMNAHVHNDPLEIGIDAGVLAAGVWIAVLLTAVYRGLRTALGSDSRDRQVLGFLFAAFFVAFGVDGLFGFNLRVPVTGMIFFIILGVASTWGETEEDETTPGWRLPAGTEVLRWVALTVLLLVAVQESRRFVSQQDLAAGVRAQIQGDPATARMKFENGRRLLPWSHVFDQRLTEAYARQGAFSEAMVAADRALEKNPYFFMGLLPAAHNRMLVAQQEMREGPQGLENAFIHLEEATQLMHALLALVPRLPQAHRLLAQVLSTEALLYDFAGGEAGREKSLPYWSEAEAHLKKAIAYEAEGRADLFRMLAQVRVPQGNISGAEVAMAEAVLHDPSETATWTMFRTFANTQRRYDRARATLEVQLGRLNEMDTPSPDTLATLYLVQANLLENGYRDIPLVLEAYTKAVEHGANRPEVWTNLARWALDNGRRGNLIRLVKAAYGRGATETAMLPQVELVGRALSDTQELTSVARGLMALIRSYDHGAKMTVAETYGWAARLVRDALLEAGPTEACGAFLDMGIAFNALDELATADAMFRQADGCLEGAHRAVLAVHWGDTLVRMDRAGRAVELLREAHASVPDDLEVWLALARGLTRMNLFLEAQAEYEALLARDDVSGRARSMMEEELAQVKTLNEGTISESEDS